MPLVRQLLYVISLRNMGLILILKARFDCDCHASISYLHNNSLTTDMLFHQNEITPVHICARYGHSELLKQLCDTYGANPTDVSYNVSFFCTYSDSVPNWILLCVSNRKMLSPFMLLHRMATFPLLIYWSQSTKLTPVFQQLCVCVCIAGNYA